MIERTVGALTSQPFIRRYRGNPVLSASDVPYPSELVYSAGVMKFRGQYVMIFSSEYHR